MFSIFVVLHSVFFGCLIIATSLHHISAHQLPPKCNSFRADCGLSSAEAVKTYVTPYAQLLPKLRQIKLKSRVPISIGPLIKNRNDPSSGLLNIDSALNSSLSPAVNVSVCGNTNTSIRNAVICTVTKSNNAPSIGNTNATRIGRSNQGRNIIGVRLGNRRNGQRVMIVTQVHGNEAASTEAAFKLLNRLTRWPKFGKNILCKFDILIVLRLNVDGGEPSAVTNIPQVSGPFMGSFGFFRHSVDRTAGGGFVIPTESNFFGVVGRGYDLNRYIYAGLQSPIRPVEAQTLVAAILSFQPTVLADLHGDAPKAICQLDKSTIIIPTISGSPPTVHCTPPAPKIPTISNDRHRSVAVGMFADDVSILSGSQFSSLRRGERFQQHVRLTRSLAAGIAKAVEHRLKVLSLGLIFYCLRMDQICNPSSLMVLPTVERWPLAPLVSDGRWLISYLDSDLPLVPLDAMDSQSSHLIPIRLMHASSKIISAFILVCSWHFSKSSHNSIMYHA